MTSPFLARPTLSLLLSCGLILAACGRAPTPAAQADEGPYAGGKSYPWSDRVGPSVLDGSTSYPWVGAHAPAAGIRPLADTSDVYLSDLTWTAATNAWGPIEKDRSNGEQAAGDGKVLTIGGQTYAKGLGMHAAAEASYALEGNCTTFTASVGVDDEVGDRGSVVFQLWNGTSQMLYDSGVLRGADGPKAVSVDVKDVTNLRLVVTSSGDSLSYDHADWGNAKLTCPSRLPSGDSFVSDLPWTLATNNWGPIEKDLSNGEKGLGDGKTLTIGGQTFQKGLGTNAPSTAAYALAGRCTVFTATIGIDDEIGSRGSSVFQVLGDGVKLYESPVLRGTDGPLTISVPVSNVNELRLVATDGGDGPSYDHADWANAKVSCVTDTTPPATPANLTASVSGANIVLDWDDNTEQDLAGYTVSRASAEEGPYTLLTSSPITASTYTDTTATLGVPQYYHVEAVDTSSNASPDASASATLPATGTPKIEVENLDGGPWSDRLVLSRIGSLASPPSNGVHNKATLRVKNTGTAVLRLTSLPIQDTFVLDTPVTLPLDIQPNSSVDLTVRFVAESTKAHFGKLTLNSNDPATPSLPVVLAGLWQSQSENGQEPDIFQIRAAFGYNGTFTGGEPSINQKGLVRPQGDEVMGGYFQRADTSQPVTIQQLAAYHTQGNTATLSWYAKGSGSSTSIFTHAGIDGQTVLPRLSNLSAGLSRGSFSPSAGTFGFKVDGEWSDPAKNSQTADRNNGCGRPCGQHLRFFTIKDRAGVLIPNTYYMIMDYSGINYDYNDVNYIISNIKPAPMLINVGGAGFTDPSGNVWLSDKDQNGDAIFTPTAAINEPTTAYNGAIQNTTNPALYRTYRGRTSDLTVPQDQRIIDFEVPLNNGTYQVKLHFAELNWTQAGKRVFDVYAENNLVIPNLDIFQQSGGRYTALVEPLTVDVKDGKLSIVLKASVDFPSLSGIEIVR